MFLFLIIYYCGGFMNRFYLINYNRLFNLDTSSLINIYFNDSVLSNIAHDILLDDNRLLDNSIDVVVLTNLIESFQLEDIWHLAGGDKSFHITRLAYDKLLNVLEEYDAVNRRYLIKIIK